MELQVIPLFKRILIFDHHSMVKKPKELLKIFRLMGHRVVSEYLGKMATPPNFLNGDFSKDFTPCKRI